jgi:hypothetical protein
MARFSDRNAQPPPVVTRLAWHPTPNQRIRARFASLRRTIGHRASGHQTGYDRFISEFMIACGRQAMETLRHHRLMSLNVKGILLGHLRNGYLRAIRDPDFANAEPVGLIYLTALDSFQEIGDSRAKWTGSAGAPFQCYQLAWQDVTEVLRDISCSLRQPHRAMATDLSSYLAALGLARFKGFTMCDIPNICESWSNVTRDFDREFAGFTTDWLGLDSEPHSFYSVAIPNEGSR